MRTYALLALSPFATCIHGQIVLDAPFINERYLLNANASLLDREVSAYELLDSNEILQSYVLNEPYFWIKRIYLRLEPSENKALTQTSLPDNILPLVEIINTAIAADSLTPYKDPEFRKPFPLDHLPLVVSSPIVLKVDFAYDYVIQELVPHIIGMSLEQANGESVNLYFPELRWNLKPYSLRTANGLVGCDAYFDRWIFKAHPAERDTTFPLPDCHYCMPVIERQAEFDALTNLFLVQRELANHAVIPKSKRTLAMTSFAPSPVFAHVNFNKAGLLEKIQVRRGKSVRMVASYSEGKPDGPYREFYPNGSLKEEGQFKAGLREGQWTSWFANRNIRSRRTYVNGLLDGVQRVYFDNGNFFLQYGMAKGDYEGLHSTYYSDGTLKSSGTMTAGFVSGEWTYAIRINDTLKHYLDEHAASFSFPASAWQDGVLSYHVTYTEKPGENGCLLGHCIQWTYSDVE